MTLIGETTKLETAVKSDHDAEAVKPAGYKGPVGLQCFSVKGDVTENLKADIAAWRKITSP